MHVLGLHLADHQTSAKTRAAPAVLAVEGEQARVQLRKTLAAARTRAVDGEGLRRRTQCTQAQHTQHPLAQLQRLAHLLAQQRFVLGRDLDHADRQLQRVLFIAVETRPFARRQILAVDTQLFVALAARPLGQIGVQALAVVHQRRQQLDRLAAMLGAEARNDGLEALRRHRHLAVGAILRAELHIEQAQKVIQLGQRGHRTLAPAAAGALLDGDRRRNAVNGIHIRPRGWLHELARIGVERFEIAPLALAKQDIEGQRGLARAGHAGDHREAAARDLHVHILQIVLARMVDADRPVAARPVGHGRLGGEAHRRGGQGRFVLGQRATGVRGFVFGHHGRRAFGHQRTAAFAALGAEIDQPVGSADDVEIVFDHQQRMTGIDQLAESAEQARDVVEMQAGGWLIKQKQRATGRLRLGGLLALARLRGKFRQMPGQLEALRLAAGQRGHRLAEAHIVEADIDDGLQRGGDGLVTVEESQRLGHRHLQHIGYVAAVDLQLQHFGSVALAVAVRAAQIHVGEELHLHMLEARAGAGRAAALAGVEAEGAGRVAALLGGGQGGETAADGVPGADVAHRIGARALADG